MGHGRKLSHYYILILHYWCIYFWKSPRGFLFIGVRLTSLMHSSRKGPCLIISAILVCLDLMWKRGAQHHWLDSKVLHTVRFLELKPLEKKMEQGWNQLKCPFDLYFSRVISCTRSHFCCKASQPQTKQGAIQKKAPVMWLDWQCHIVAVTTDRLQTTRVSKKYLWCWLFT